MTVEPLDLDAELDAYRQRACTGKGAFGARGAREAAARMRAEKAGEHLSPYPCPFCDAWHVGHALGMETLAYIARLLRARSGNVPVAPGSGTTKRQRRKAQRR